MSVQIIDGGDVAALYCDTDDVAFGPVFKSAEHAEDFCRWLRAGYEERVRNGYSMSWFHSPDPRWYREQDLRAHYGLWRSERVDDESGELLPVELRTV